MPNAELDVDEGELLVNAANGEPNALVVPVDPKALVVPVAFANGLDPNTLGAEVVEGLSSLNAANELVLVPDLLNGEFEKGLA